MYRWNEFPGLEFAVKKVNDIDWSDLKGVPGGPFEFDIPKFADGPLPDNTEVSRTGNAANALVNNGGPIQNHTKVEVESELEEGEIVEIKQEAKEEPGVPLDIAPSNDLPPSESSSRSYHTQSVPHHYGYPYQLGFQDCPPGTPSQWAPESPAPPPGYPSNNWHGLPYHYHQPSFPSYYAASPYYNFASRSSGPEDSSSGGANPRPSYGALHPQLHAFPQRFGIPTPGTSPLAIPRLPSLPPRDCSKPTPYVKLEPPRTTNPPPASPSELNQPDSQQGVKRKLSTSRDGSNSGATRLLKRLRPLASDFMSDDADPQHVQSKHSQLANGLPDFGAWFQDQVTGSKKKLSHLEHASALVDTKKGA